jgi:hypothetical protein
MKNYLNALLISLALIMCTSIMAYTYLNRNPKDSKGSIFVKGMGQTNFDSDLIVWEGKYSKESNNMKDAYAGIEKDKEIVLEFLLSNGIEKSEIVFGAVNTTELNKTLYSDEGKYIGEEFLGYQMSQEVMIESKDVEKVEEVSRAVTQVLNSGVRFYSYQPRYYFTKLADLKIDLISKATEDARVRAVNISGKSGAKLGDLVSAEMGVLQIVGQNSDEAYSWGGTLNTSSKKKTASITMTLNYRVENE